MRRSRVALNPFLRLFGLLAAVGFVAAVQAEPVARPDKPGEVVVIARDGSNAEPVPCLRVDEVRAHRASWTDSLGRARLFGLTSGPHELKLVRPGYADTFMSIVVRPNGRRSTVRCSLRRLGGRIPNCMEVYDPRVPGCVDPAVPEPDTAGVILHR